MDEGKIIENLYTLFDAAWEENMNGRGTDITRMVTTFVSAAIQNLQAYEEKEEDDRVDKIIEKLEKLKMSCKNYLSKNRQCLDANGLEYLIGLLIDWIKAL